jgi:hypothetical protein
MGKPELNIAAANDEPQTTMVERGPYRAIVSEHFDRGVIYLLLENGRGHSCAFLEPTAALEIAEALIAGAGRAIEAQYQRQLGRE